VLSTGDQCIGSGMTHLGEGGKATVNIDDAYDMSRGTFVASTCNHRGFCSNVGGFTPIRSDVEGNEIKIFAADPDCRDKVFWQVIAQMR